jgi:DNA-binding transcriptional regulator YdaS (Cro superfamily)
VPKSKRSLVPLHLEKDPTRRAIGLAGGPSAVASHFDISPQAVSRWLKTASVPAKWVIPLEKLLKSAVSRHELRPDLYPEND